MVIQEERTGFSPKKPKPNKIPQRGLGIAALEKLRREDQQRKIAAAFSSGDNIAAASSAGNFSGSSKTCFLSNYPLLRPHLNAGDGSSSSVWSSKQSESSSRCSLVMKNFLSPPFSSGASLQMEPPSNQSYVSINPPPIPIPEQKFASLKRPWPFQPGSSPQCGNHHKRTAFSRDDVRAEGETSKLDGSLLSLGLLPVSEQTIPFHKHYCMQQIQKNTEEKMLEAAGPPTLHNFMGLPHDLIGSHPSDAQAESKD